MAAAGCPLAKDRLLCSICRDVLTDPVSTPCGHNFCKDCVTETDDVDVPFQCPVCMKMFYPKPELQVNTLISDMVDAFRRSEQQAARREEGLHGLWFTAILLLFCLVCSFLSDAMKSNHLLKEVSTGGKLEKMEAEIQQAIEEMQLKIEELKRSVELSAKDADREIADGVQFFAALKESAERGEAKLLETIREKQRRMELQGEDFIKKLQQDIGELKKRKTDVELISVIQLKETLSEEHVREILARTDLRRAQVHEVDVTLNPDTANQFLVLSDDRKQVYRSNLEQYRPYNSERFYYSAAVLGQQSFSSGRFYFEVQIKGKTGWDLGVASKSINRMSGVTSSPADGFWTLGMRNGNEYKAGPDVRLHLWSAPEKLGVFVDYEEGLVSFYDVDSAALICSFTGCSFSEELYPYFRPDLGNSSPLIITPVD